MLKKAQQINKKRTSRNEKSFFRKVQRSKYYKHLCWSFGGFESKLLMSKKQFKDLHITVSVLVLKPKTNLIRPVPLSSLRSTRCSRQVCRIWARKELLLPCRKRHRSLCSTRGDRGLRSFLSHGKTCSAGARSGSRALHKTPAHLR